MLEMMLPRLPDVSFNYQIFGEMGTKIVPPKNINQCYW